MIIGFIQVTEQKTIMDMQQLTIEKSCFHIDKFSQSICFCPEQFSHGDIIVFDSIIHFAKDPGRAFSLLSKCMKHKLGIAFVKESKQYGFDDISRPILESFFREAAQLSEGIRSDISKEALMIRKERGVKLGRKLGSPNVKPHKFEDMVPKVKSLLKKNKSMRQVAIQLKIPQSTLFTLVKRHPEIRCEGNKNVQRIE